MLRSHLQMRPGISNGTRCRRTGEIMASPNAEVEAETYEAERNARYQRREGFC